MVVTLPFVLGVVAILLEVLRGTLVVMIPGRGTHFYFPVFSKTQQYFNKDVKCIFTLIYFMVRFTGRLSQR